jgi:hypothetical protein
MIGRILICLMIIGLWVRADAQQYPANQIIVQQPGDADATISANSSKVVTGALTATRVWTMPAASAVVLGGQISVIDLSGVVGSPGNQIIIKAAGSDTINGRTSYALRRPFGSVTFTSDHSGKWVASAEAQDEPNAARTTSINQYGAVQGPIPLVKIYPAPTTAPGPGVGWLFITKGTNAGSCKLAMMVGTSTTVNTVLDNMAGGFGIGGC